MSTPNNTETGPGAAATTSSTPSPTSVAPISSTPAVTSSSTPQATSSTSSPSPTTTSTTIVTTTSQIPTSSSSPTPTSSSTIVTTPSPTSSSVPVPTTSSTPLITSSSPIPTSKASESPSSTFTSVVTVTSNPPPSGTASTSETASSTAGPGGQLGPPDPAKSGWESGGKIAVAVVVPIAAVALLVAAGIFFWRRRRQRKDAEEQRRKEVEDYGYNPNADPTMPAVAGSGSYELGEDASSGYRGWGSTTLAGSTGRKASTTMSGGGAFSDVASPTRGADARSGDPLMSDRAVSPEGEILGAMGPSAANNQSNVHRGPSNASSSYSAAARSDGSGDAGIAYGSSPGYYDQYGNNPYNDATYPPRTGPQDMGGQPVIRDVAARRNTRIENNAHFPQQTAGISQNF